MSRQTDEELTELLDARGISASERRRLRGVLAQRRYRRRRRNSNSQGSSNGNSARSRHSIELLPSSFDWNLSLGSFPETSSLSFPYVDTPDSVSAPHVGFPGLSPPPQSLADGQVVTPVNGRPGKAMQPLPQFTAFADEHFVNMPQLGALKARLLVLETLFNGVGLSFEINSIWDTFAKSPFHAYVPIPDSFASLPTHLYPTAAQLAIPHHPVFDAIPWPAVREKVLLVLSLPIAQRPKPVQDSIENVVLTYKFDSMDAAEGMKLHGPNPFDSQSWEVGQRLFQHWWWALDSDIIRNSNNLREQRGAPRLKLMELD